MYTIRILPGPLIHHFIFCQKYIIEIHGATAPRGQDRLKWLLSDGSTGDFVVSKALIPQLYFSFLNRISLLLISSSYPIVLTRLGGPRSRPYTSRNISRVQSGIEPGTSWMAVRRANHYTKKVVNFNSWCYLISKLKCSALPRSPLTTSLGLQHSAM